MSGIRTVLFAMGILLFSHLSMAASLTMISEILVKPESADKFLAWITKDVEYSRGFKGNLQFDIYRAPDNSGKFLFIERWESKQHQEEYNRWRAQRGDFLKMRAYLIAPPNMSTIADSAND